MIQSNLVAPSGRYLNRRGHDPSPLYSKYGWRAEDIDEGRIRVPLGDFFEFLETASATTGTRISACTFGSISTSATSACWASACCPPPTSARPCRR